jgi:hypothetical protein
MVEVNINTDGCAVVSEDGLVHWRPIHGDSYIAQRMRAAFELGRWWTRWMTLCEGLRLNNYRTIAGLPNPGLSQKDVTCIFCLGGKRLLG